MARQVLPRNIRSSVQKQSRTLLETGQRFQRFDQLRQRHFWSNHRWTPDDDGYIKAGTYTVFTTPPGQVGQGYDVALTERDTNWKSANRVPDNQNFEVTEIGVNLGVASALIGLVQIQAPAIYEPMTDALSAAMYWIRQQFLSNTVVEIKYLTNTVPLGMASDFAQASGSMAGTAAILTQNTNGFAAPALRRRFKIPILLQHGETFSFSFNIPRTFSVGLTQFPGYAALIEGGFQLEARFDFWATESFVEKS